MITRERVPKTVNGVEVTQQEFRRAIFDIIESFPDGARAGDVIAGLGGNWAYDQGPRWISATLNNLKKAGYLKSVDGRRGLYQTTRLVERGVDQFERFELDIIKSISDRGGIMRLKDIRDLYAPDGVTRVSFGRRSASRVTPARKYKSIGDGIADDVRDVLEERQKFYDSQTSNVLRTIEKSDRIRQSNMQSGIYHVAYQFLARIPQVGRNLSIMMRAVGHAAWKRQIDEGVPLTTVDRGNWMRTLRPVQFANIGSMAEALRVTFNMSLQEVVAHPAMVKAMWRTRNYANNLVQDIISSLIREEVAEGGDNEWRPDETLIDASILYWFEQGVESAHMTLEQDFIEGLAAVYECDAAYLSLGVAMPIEDAEKVKATRRMNRDDEIEVEKRLKAAE